MILHYPFVEFKGQPALEIAEGIHLVLDGVDMYEPEPMRDVASMAIYTPEGLLYSDQTMRSGHGGFGSPVSIFETYLGFLDACLESVRYRQRTGHEAENEDLFPVHVREALESHADDIAYIRCCLLLDEESNVNTHLIEEFE